MKTYIVEKTIVIAGHPYQAGEVLKPEHERKVPNLLRLGHVVEALAEQEQLPPSEPKADEKLKAKAK